MEGCVCFDLDLVRGAVSGCHDPGVGLGAEIVFGGPAGGFIDAGIPGADGAGVLGLIDAADDKGGDVPGGRVDVDTGECFRGGDGAIAFGNDESLQLFEAGNEVGAGTGIRGLFVKNEIDGGIVLGFIHGLEGDGGLSRCRGRCDANGENAIRLGGICQEAVVAIKKMDSRSGVASADLDNFESVNVPRHEALDLAGRGGPWRRRQRIDALVDGVFI